VWDNLYSQYDDKPIKHEDKFTAVYKLREFSNLGLALKIRYDQLSQRLAFELVNHSTDEKSTGTSSLVYLNLDFKNLNIQMSQKNHKICIKKGISRIASLDLTDLDNIWRFVAFNLGEYSLDSEGNEIGAEDSTVVTRKFYKKYHLNLDAFDGLIPESKKKEIPTIYAYLRESDNVIEYINVKLTPESISFKLSHFNSKHKPEFKKISGCTTSI
jgi:hypothetical protein